MNENYFISAGEFSGDLLVAELVVEIGKLCPTLIPSGITGPSLRAVGVQSMLDNQKLAVMGISDVLKRISQIRLIEQRILQQIDQLKPRFAILVDYPGFHFRLAEQLKMRGIPVVQYIAPKVWAWGAGRIQRLRRDFDLVLGMLPFEVDYFREREVPYHYVGSPIVDRINNFLKSYKHDLDSKSSVVGCLPGSRESEIKNMLPFFLELRNHLPSDNKIIVSVAENIGWSRMCVLCPELQSAHAPSASFSTNSEFNEAYEYKGILFVVGQSFEIMLHSGVALVTSGTATLECALIGTPQIVVYKTHSLTYFIARTFLQIKYVSLPNLIMNKEIIKEYLQDFTVSRIAKEANLLLKNQEHRQKMLAEYASMQTRLKGGAATTAAQIILKKYGFR